MHRFILPLLVLAGTLCLLGLGTWQMQRLAWKEALIAEREAGLAKRPAILPQTFANVEDAEAFNFRNVSVTGVFRHDLEQLFGAKARGGVLGHHILTPLVPANGSAVLVDRGWVPADKAHPASRPEGQIEGEVTVGGIARFRAADRPGVFTPDNDPAAGEWYHYDLDAMAAALGFELSPVVVEVDGTPNPGGLPIGGRTVIQLTNNHLQYALTWYGLAAALVGVYIVFWRQRRARPGATT
ncbi:MAG: SURF1 family protein [Geminicoccaceae bacterium]